MLTRVGSGATESLRRILLGYRSPIAASLDDAVVLHVPGGSGLSGEYQGAEAVLGLCIRMDRLTAGTMRFAPSGMLNEGDDAVVVEGRVSGTHQNVQLDARAVHVFSIRGGRIAEIWLFNEDQQRVDAFWLSLSDCGSVATGQAVTNSSAMCGATSLAERSSLPCER